MIIIGYNYASLKRKSWYAQAGLKKDGTLTFYPKNSVFHL